LKCDFVSCTSKNFSISKSTLGARKGPEGCLHRSQAPNLSSGTGADQSGNKGEMGAVETAKENSLIAAEFVARIIIAPLI
jgi:hypothetical protein